MSSRTIAIAGGGAAGIFAAIACAEANPGAKVTVFEKSSQFLGKVRISGGGRCNVTHACFEARSFATRFPRGEQALISPLTRFQASDAMSWFEARGVRLKVEGDGRVFPVSDSSSTIVDCLLQGARAAGVELMANCSVVSAKRNGEGCFELELTSGFKRSCDRLLLATGGCRTPALGQLAVSLGHTLQDPVPSLFTFHVETPWIHDLSGVSAEMVEAEVPGTRLRERGPLLLTHRGFSGPVILRLSAWGARKLHSLGYAFPLLINWLPLLAEAKLSADLNHRRKTSPSRLVVNSAPASLPSRIWEQLALAAGIPADRRWSGLSRQEQHQLTQQLIRSEFPVTGKTLNKDEFVTCGGVDLAEVNFKTMESRLCPGLFFAGELLDIDGVTGGFNFQAAWTTGWLAGRAMAEAC